MSLPTFRRPPLWVLLSGLAAVALLTWALLARQDAGPTGTVPPLPFRTTDSAALHGALTNIGATTSGFAVVRVTFGAGERDEALSEDTVYLVYIPDDPAVPAGPFDAAMALAGGTRDVNYYGYRYVDGTASAEIREANAAAFKDRFPGQFFASQKARDQDAALGNGMASFEAANGITFHRTDGSDGAARLERGALYALVVNEPSGSRLTVRPLPRCGDGRVDAGEQCDDGNAANADSCTNACTAPSCGDGFRQGAEECDDGNREDADACTNSCTSGIPLPFGDGQTGGTSGDGPEQPGPACGNGVREAGEQCDDGNTASGDGCGATCTVEQGYACVENDGGRSTCGAAGNDGEDSPVCGDGVREANEQCDDGERNGQTCSPSLGSSCSFCTEQCTTATLVSDPPPTICGNGLRESAETCDDGNTASGDGCGATCAVEQGYTCTTATPNVCTPNEAGGGETPSVRDRVLQLADTNHDGSVSDTEALLLTLDVVEAPDREFDPALDMDGNGTMDDADVAAILTELDALAQ